MTMQTSRGHCQIERRLDVVLIPGPHVIAAIGGVPINWRLEPVVIRVIEIGSSSVSRADEVFKAPPAMEPAVLKFPSAVIIEPPLPFFLRDSFLSHLWLVVT